VESIDCSNREPLIYAILCF